MAMIVFPSQTPQKKNYIFGTNDDDNLVGTHLDETIYAYEGQDKLNGGGGKDTLYGGKGDDWYFIHDTDDKVVEYAGEGYDWVFSYVTAYTLTDNVERLSLNGQALYGTGNGGDNWLSGNGQNNILAGLDGKDHLDGGLGADLMIGGKGDDYYQVDNSSDAIWEFDGEGKDAVHATANFTLGANIEDLYLDNVGAIDGTGNDGDNYIVGNTSDNILKGMGGKDNFSGVGGKDTMYGGAGDDYYTVNSTDDLVFESAGEGFDVIFTSVDYTTPTDVEHMTLDGATAVTGKGNNQDNSILGSHADNFLFGYGGKDVLDGSTGNDTIDGGAGDDRLIGGKDHDTLIGGANNDRFEFAKFQGNDTVTDFKANGDLDVIGFKPGIFSDFVDMLYSTKQVGNDTVIKLDAAGSTVVTLQGVDMSTLQAQDFHYMV
jgi:trimeric autotransporter adhesin